MTPEQIRDFFNFMYYQMDIIKFAEIFFNIDYYDTPEDDYRRLATDHLWEHFDQNNKWAIFHFINKLDDSQVESLFGAINRYAEGRG